MSERPITFSAPMIKAILDGSKTQTRRVVNPQPAPFVRHTPDRWPTTRTEPYIDAYCGKKKTEANPRGMGLNWHWWTADDRLGDRVARCPYGFPGDTLYVKEKLCRTASGLIAYEDGTHASSCGWAWKGNTVNARFMPRFYSRIDLEITSVKVERLQDISVQDVLSEGIVPLAVGSLSPGNRYATANAEFLIGEFERLWDSLYKKEPEKQWDANPWVFVIEFKRVNP